MGTSMIGKKKCIKTNRKPSRYYIAKLQNWPIATLINVQKKWVIFISHWLVKIHWSFIKEQVSGSNISMQYIESTKKLTTNNNNNNKKTKGD